MEEITHLPTASCSELPTNLATVTGEFLQPPESLDGDEAGSAMEGLVSKAREAG